MISVIVIGYNIKPYIIRCIESIINQTYNDFEIIYVDDGSVDGTYEHIFEYKNKNKLNNLNLYKKDNEGCVKTRLYGLSKVKGEYFTFIDGDDYYYNNNVLLSMYKSINKNNADIACLSYNTQTKNGNIIFTDIANNTNINFSIGYQYLELTVSDKILHCVDSRLYKKQLFDRIDFSDAPSVNLAEDLYFTTKVGLEKPIVNYEKKISVLYCYNNNSITKNKCFDRYNEYIIVLETIEKCINNDKNFINKYDLINSAWIVFYKIVFRDFSISLNNKIKYCNIAFNHIMNFRFSNYLDKNIKNIYTISIVELTKILPKPIFFLLTLLNIFLYHIKNIFKII